MEQDAANTDRLLKLSDTLRVEWEADQVAVVKDLLMRERREDLEFLVYCLLNDLEAASGE